MYGWSLDEALGQTINVLLASDPVAWAALKEQLVRTGYWDGQLLQRRKSGVTVLGHCREVLMRDASGPHSAVLAIKRDITEQHRAIEALKEADRRKDEFLATLSHEMRTPLNGVIGASDLLISTKLNEEQKDLIATLKKSAPLLLKLIDNILDLSKIESGKLVSEKVDFDLHKLVNNTLEMFLPQVEKNFLS
jgi:signal transduction histidine kinase